MAGYPPLKNSAYSFEVPLEPAGGDDAFQSNPTLAEGDVKVSKDGGSFANITTLPTAIDAGSVVTVALSADEMNADRIVVLFHDAAGDEWRDAFAEVFTDTAQMNDLSTLTSAEVNAECDTAISDAGIVAAIATVDDVADDILTDTGTDIPALIAALNDPAAAAIADAVWDEVIAGHLTAGTAGLYLSYLGGGTVDTNSPVTNANNIALYEGDDYYDADGNSLEWTDTGSAWPTLVGASVMMYVRAATGAPWSAAGTVVVGAGAGKKVRVELSNAQTTSLVDLPGPSWYRVRATLTNGHVVTLVAGRLTVETDIS